MFRLNGRVFDQDVVAISNKFDSEELSIFAKKKILVTGCTGLIGFYIVCVLRYLSKTRGLNIEIFGSSRDKSAAAERFLKYLNESPVQTVFLGDEDKHGPFDFIFHTASSTNPVDLLTRPLDVINTNVNYTYELLKLLSPKTGTFLFFSTREIYGKKVDPNVSLIGENDYGVLDPLDVRSSYPESKRLAENLIVSFNSQCGNPYRIFRISHTYGPGIKLNDGRVLSDIIGSMVNDEDINLKSNGLHVISPTYISDVISGVFAGIARGENGCYNVSNHYEIYSVADIASIAAENTPNSKVTLQSSPTHGGMYLKHDTGILSSEKIGRLLGGFDVSLREGMRRVYNHYKIGES